LFMKSRVGAFYAAGGLPFSGGGGAPDGGTSRDASGVDTGADAAAAPAFTVTTAASPSSVTAGQASAIQVSGKHTGAPRTGGIVDIEVNDASGTKVGQQFFPAQPSTTGQTQNYTYNFTTPAAAGTFKVTVGVFGTNWTPLYFW